MRTYSSPVSPDFVPRSAISAASLLLSLAASQIEGVAVVDPLLSCQGGKAFSSNPEPTRFGVLLRAFSGPLCCLIPAPCRGHGNQSEYQRFENFNRFKTGLRRSAVLAHLV